MARVLKASCNSSGEVLFNNIKVDVAEVLSEGKQDSEGVLLMDKELVFYLASSATDIKETLIKLSSVLDEINNALQAIDDQKFLIAAQSGVVSPPIMSSSISALNSLKNEVENLKDGLK